MGATDMITVALTSIPPRFGTLAARLSALLAQRPTRVCLTLPHSYRRFPDWDGPLPTLPSGIEILRSDDHGPATKFLTAFQKYRWDDVLIADDDCDYGPGWLDAFRAARRNHPDPAIAASTFDTSRLGLPSGHKIAQGFAGIMVRPNHLPQSVLSPPNPAIWVDDIWLSAQLAKANIKIIECPDALAQVSAPPAPGALQDAVIDAQTRAGLNRSVAHELKHSLGIWR